MVSDLAEFGTGNRDEFYVWLMRKYPDQSPLSMARFTKLCDLTK
jgi:hypothetical protein